MAKSFTPRALAEQWNTTDAKVRELIRTGKLAAFNTSSGDRPTWHIPESEVLAYEARASSQPIKLRRGRRKPSHTIPFFK